MSTQVIVLGETKPQKRLKPIEFRSLLNYVEVNRSDEAIVKTSFGDHKPRNYKYIELICRNYQAGLDLMFAYNDPEDRGGVLYIGHFNDGVVE